MQSPLRCFGVGVVLLSLAPSTLTFSSGAGHASCRDMIPGHIRAQPRDPKRVHVALRTSASSYRPGQFVTVTVRSSRDFMGFLLQARRVEGPEVGARTGARSTSMGPVVVGGSWTLTPPGTHTLRCLSEGDTLTHSDKQLKRNLSFVWRAPEGPMGDIRFYITVVQSYFVYWAGIESAVVRDGSRSPWTGSNISVVDGGNSALQEDEVTALPGEAEEAGTDTGSSEDPKSSLQSTNHVPPMASFSPAEAEGVETTTNLLPNITGALFLLHSLASLPPLKDALSSSSASSTSSISSPPSSPSSSSSISTSTPTSSSSNLSATSSLSSSQSTSPHPEPSPAPRRSLYNPLTSSTTSSPVPSKQPTLGQRLPIQNHIESSDPESNLNLPTPRTVVHPNPERHPNLDPNFDLNLGPELKPNLPKTGTKPKPPSNPPGPPDKEGKYPDINPRHSAWELGMLLGCSAGLGMVLVVGVRYMCRQACGKQTEVTLNDRETEYGRGERGLLHVQECGDLVRVRRIRENSFVLLAEYDVLASPGD
ncbi:reelin domain-containing protein 1-like [Cebidichthys violaceus]|uniref:reelin domain-containing protein 1-like n=1 Tax=Cebidichthys violaceus TaxID=271503 RepID=UPI0035CB3212